MAGDEDKVSKAEFVMYAKGINGDLDDIKKACHVLTEKIDRRFDALDAKLEQERRDGREAHQRIHTSIGVTNKAVAKIREGNWSRSTAAIVAVLSAACTGLIVAFVTQL